MERMNIRELAPGLTLDQDVKDQNGRILASTGQILTPKLIRIFKIWGIGEVRVKVSDGRNAECEMKNHISEHIREKAEEIVRFRFQHNDLNDPFVRELFNISCRKKELQLEKFPDNISLPTHFKPRKKSEDRGMRRKKINVNYLLQKTLRMETIPDIYYKIIAAVNNPNASLNDISRIVNKDVTLSAKVLQLVNSSFYSLSKKVDTLTWALALIGTNQLITIVSGVSILSLFKNIPSQLINMASFWEHSVACGTAARILSSYLKVGIETERFFVAGLLHDIGRLILIQNLPDHYLDLFERAGKEKIFLCSAEADKFGMDHSQIGAELSFHWNLPDGLAEMIKHHHSPLKGKAFRETSIINLADIMVNALEIGNSGEFFVPVVEPAVCRELSVGKDILQPVINQLENQLEGIFQIVYG